jgi:hypothetical protein
MFSSMRKSWFALFLIAALLFISCEKSTDSKTGFFDSLLVANTNYFVKANAGLTKYALISGKQDTILLKPDSTTWKNELDIFNQLNVFQKAAYRDAYEIEDGLRDTQSNLSVRQYKATRSVPVPLLRFYYYNQFRQLKKIEAQYRNVNSLYSTTRNLVMEFENRNGKAVLTRYSLNGTQHMILSDSLTFSVKCDVTLPKQ